MSVEPTHVPDRQPGPPTAAGPTTASAPLAAPMPMLSLAALATAGPAARGRAVGQMQRGAGNAAVARLLGGAPRTLQRFVRFPAAPEKTVDERIASMQRELEGMHADRRRICQAYLDLKGRNEEESSGVLEGWLNVLGLRPRPRAPEGGPRSAGELPAAAMGSGRAEPPSSSPVTSVPAAASPSASSPLLPTEASLPSPAAVSPTPPPAEAGRQTLTGEESAVELENKLKGVNNGITGIEHEIFVATFLHQQGAIKGPEHISVGSSKISGGGGEIDAMATIGEQKYLVEAKAAGVNPPPGQTKKNVSLILEHKGEYGMAWAIDSPHKHAKEFINYVAKIHQALRDVGVPGLSTHNGGATYKHFKDTYKDGDPDEAWYIKHALEAASSSPRKAESSAEKQGKDEKKGKDEKEVTIDPKLLEPFGIRNLDKMKPLMQMLVHVAAANMQTMATKVNERDDPAKPRSAGRKTEVLRDLLTEHERTRPRGADEIPTDPNQLTPQQADTLVTFYRNELDRHGIKFFLLQLNSQVEGPQTPAGGPAATPFGQQPSPSSLFSPPSSRFPSLTSSSFSSPAPASLSLPSPSPTSPASSPAPRPGLVPSISAPSPSAPGATETRDDAD